MKKYVSLGAAMMLGTVLARKAETAVESQIKKSHHSDHEKKVAPVPEPVV